MLPTFFLPPLLLLLFFVTSAAANPEEIELGDEDDDDDADNEAAAAADGEEPELQQKAVPAAVFGALAGQGDAGEQQQQGEQQLGALERFKKRRVE
jgi:hypothetical protein